MQNLERTHFEKNNNLTSLSIKARVNSNHRLQHLFLDSSLSLNLELRPSMGFPRKYILSSSFDVLIPFEMLDIEVRGIKYYYL